MNTQKKALSIIGASVSMAFVIAIGLAVFQSRISVETELTNLRNVEESSAQIVMNKTSRFEVGQVFNQRGKRQDGSINNSELGGLDNIRGVSLLF